MVTGNGSFNTILFIIKTFLITKFDCMRKYPVCWFFDKIYPWILENPYLPKYVIPKEIHLPGHRLLRFRHRVFRGPRGQYPHFAFPGITLYWQFCSQILKVNLFFPIKYIPCTLYNRTQNAEMLEINGDNWGNSENFGCRHRGLEMYKQIDSKY